MSTPILTTDPNQDAIEDVQDFGEPLARAEASPPPSTVGELRQVFMDYEASRPRSLQVRLGPSEIGTPCQQKMARKLAGAPQRPVLEPQWAPWLGTAGHTSMSEEVLPFWNKQLGEDRWAAEDSLEVEPGRDGIDGIYGHGDAFDELHGTVVDWKFLGNFSLDKLRAARRRELPVSEWVSPEYRIQTHLYGRGHARKGRNVRWVRLVLFARTSARYDDAEEWTEAYDPTIAEHAIERYFDTAQLTRELDLEGHPDQIASVPATPSTEACKFCPFHRPDRKVTDWASCSGLAGDNPGREAMARLRRSALLNKIKRAKTVADLVAIWQSAVATSTWTDEATAAAKSRKKQLDPCTCGPQQHCHRDTCKGTAA